MYSISQEDTNNKRPGAAITMNPIAAGAKFVMEKNASDKTVKKTAKQISEKVIKKINSGAVAAGK